MRTLIEYCSGPGFYVINEWKAPDSLGYHSLRFITMDFTVFGDFFGGFSSLFWHVDFFQIFGDVGFKLFTGAFLAPLTTGDTCHSPC